MPKICKVINDKLTWLLEVDGKRISFTGEENAMYFLNHYRQLSYSVILEDRS